MTDTDPTELLAGIPTPDVGAPLDFPPVDEPPTKSKRPTTRAGRAARSRARAASSGGSTRQDKPPAGPRKAPLGRRVGELYEGVGALVAMAEPDVGAAVMACGPAAGEAWAEVARSNPRVAAALERMLTGSAYGGLVMAHLPILLAVIAKTGKTPPGLSAVFTPTMPSPCFGCGGVGGHAPDCPTLDPDAPMFTATVPPAPSMDDAAAA